ncbi:MAG: terminase [Chloroflexi bacterium]|nr:terminase [Chloroflexota bacterium]
MSIPDYSSSTGEEAVDLARMAGLDLDPWQEFVLANSLGERSDGRWAAFEVGLVVSRQNGKGAILEARELAGLFLLGEKLIIHSAHEFTTSREHQIRLTELIQGTPEFHARVKPKGYKNSHGEEGIELKSGQRIRFKTRTKSGGRGFSSDCLILDEAMILPDSAHGALLPTLSARPNPQVWYTGSAVDQEIHEHGLVLARLRKRGHEGGDPSLAYFEWTADADTDSVEQVADDPDAWADANPGLGIRISSEYVANERRSMDARTFAVERLGVGDWPNLEGVDGDGISREMWDACKDQTSKVNHPAVFAFDVRPNRSASAVCVAGLRDDGLYHVEVVDHRPGTGWVPQRLAELVERHHPSAVICDQASPAAALLGKLAKLGVDVETVGPKEHAQGCGVLFDAVEQRALRHLGTAEIAAAVAGASRRPLGEAWAWSRKSSAVDISPLVAATLALWGAQTDSGPSVYEDRGLLVV